MQNNISEHIFRAYDIRGIYQEDISPELFYKIGQAAGTYVKKDLKGDTLTAGNDIRKSSPSLIHSFVSGVTSVGVNVDFTGTSSFGQTLFSGWKQKRSLIAFVTASHLPPEWNGIKFYFGDGVGLPVEALEKIRDYTLKGEFETVDWRTVGLVETVDAHNGYKDFFVSKFNFKKPIKVALDCGGASMTLSAPEVFNALHLNFAPVFCEPDPLFSNRPSEPKEENLGVLINTVKEQNCDFGVAFDGDGDRAVIVDNTGKVLSADETGIILGKYGITGNKGAVIVNVEVSKAVKEQLEPLGFSVKQIRVGHTFLTLAGKKENACLGIESSGHIIIPEYFLFDDAMVTPLKMAELLQNNTKTLSEMVGELPMYPTVREEIKCPDDIKFKVIEQLSNELCSKYKNTSTLDGIRVNLDDGWVLIRPSNTGPVIRLTAEADSQKSLNTIKSEFMQKLQKIINENK